MPRLLVAQVLLAFMVLGQAPDRGGGKPDLAQLPAILNFETPHASNWPTGWSGGPPGTILVDGKIVHSGQWSARIERQAGSPDGFSTLTLAIPMDFSGNTIGLHGFLRTEEVSDFAGLWMREDGDSGPVAFDNMQQLQLKGTTGWQEYSITLPLQKEGRQLFLGVLLAGTGKAWVDDLRLLVDGKPVWDAPKIERPKTPLDTDHQFDSGSGIVLKQLSRSQAGNLAMLGRVWGFLKYHHPQAASGQRHWDYDLFRVLPAILAARDRAASNAALAEWIDGLGPLAPCQTCAKLDESRIHLRPETDWIQDETLLGSELSRRLQAIHRNRPAGKQFYVSLVPGVGNPSFDHEPAYSKIALPDAGFQLLALFRFWNIVEYWFPYRDVIGGDWNQVLVEFIPRISLAKDSESYHRELLALIARVNDTHANLWSSLQVRPPAGKCRLPVNIRFIGEEPVVAGYANPEAGKTASVKPGDVITELDGVPVGTLVGRWKPYYAASNEVTRLRDIGANMTRGECGDLRIGVRRGSESLQLAASRLPDAEPGKAAPTSCFTTSRRHIPSPLERGRLSETFVSQSGGCSSPHRGREGNQGLIIDIRNYPSEFVVFVLGSRLVDWRTPFVRFTSGDLSNPGAFHWGQPLSLGLESPHYTGKVVILVDETTQSQAEYTAMALRSAPRAVVVGSTTAGADGNISPIPLPGGLRSMISGIGVFYPDKRPTQRVGIVPDVLVRPTIDGIRAGRDEVLEEAVRQIMGKDMPTAEIEKITRP